jgi:hypothetical protein
MSPVKETSNKTVPMDGFLSTTYSIMSALPDSLVSEIINRLLFSIKIQMLFLYGVTVSLTRLLPQCHASQYVEYAYVDTIWTQGVVLFCNFIHFLEMF